MLDQNTTTLLSTLLGGLLTSMGGFLANFYAQSNLRKTDKQKAIRNMLEQIYREMKIIEVTCFELDKFSERAWIEAEASRLEEIDADAAASISRGITNSIEEKKRKINDSLSKIELLVTLYLPPLFDNFTEYQAKINDIIKKEAYESEQFSEDPREISKQLQRSILSLSQKRGYRYFY